MVVEPTHLKTEIKYMNPHIPKIKAKRIGVFHILEDKHTLVAGFKARFRINISGVSFWNRREGKLSFLSCRLIWGIKVAGAYLYPVKLRLSWVNRIRKLFLIKCRGSV